MKLTGSQIVLEVLLEQGVDTVFGYPGGTALNIYDELYKYSDKINHVLTAHEQGASHAADGYARATGKTGVVMSTSGPGATNLVTGIATAYMDSIPIVAITSNVPDNLIGRDAFQEICITGVTMPITKHNFFVNDIDELADTLREAFRIAGSGRKGPVLVDITKDVTAAVTDYVKKDAVEPSPLPIIKDEDVDAIAAMINKAKKPVAYIGGGVVASDAAEEVRALIDKCNIPVTYTLMAAGVIGHDHPMNLGMLGMHGTISANKAISQADFVLTLGARFSDRVALNTKSFAKKADIAMVDIDKSEINKNVEVDVSCIGDVKDFVTKLLPKVKEAEHPEWDETITQWKEKERVVKAPGCKLHPSEIVEIMCDKAEDDTIYVTDVGQHQMWAAQYIKHNAAKKFLTSGGLGTMGYGYGAAIGAQIACPDNRVIHITGDGSFHMNLNEACTAVSNNLPIITVIMNNQVLGMVYQWQTIFYDKRFSNTTPERKTDFVKLIEAFGGTGYRAETPEEFAEAMDKALMADGPVWIDCRISREERVLPMIPPTKSVESMIID
ncbi:MAG: biosynthetic-type acetolactate synthase large subunit [Eubacteriaceae bacterium]|nr:biosynthetic-type acetolactate synthase large subunit [Eubacteriaceae bacterium]